VAKQTPEIEHYRSQLANLKREADSMTGRQAVAHAQLASGSSDDQIETAARALIANPKTAVLTPDPEAELRETSARLAVNKKAQAIMSKSLGLLELREGYAAAKPAFDRAVGHVPKLAALLAALETEQTAATKDLRAFEAADPAGLAAQHPEEPAPYLEAQLAPLRTWQFEVIGDGYNRSRLDLWREECAELGLSLRA
jgi:hypothetical protein